MSQWSSRYPYDESNVRKHAPTSGGVYRLIYKKGDKFLVFYVGQSKNLESRLLDHLAPDEPDACIRRHVRDYSCYFRWLEVSSAADRDRIEEEQIEEYNPSCNG